MIPRRVLLAAVAIALLVVVVLLGQGRDRRATVEPSSEATLPGAQVAARSGDTAGGATRSASPSPNSTAGDVDEAAQEDLDEAVPSPTPAPAVWDADAATSAGQAATAALEAFARPTEPEVDAAAWWARLEPTLSTAAAQVYERVDPRLVPYTQVLQVDAAQPAASDLLATVSASTDAGPYEVLLSRVDGASAWVVEQLRPQQTEP